MQHNNTISKFLASWKKYFPGCEMPIGFTYSDTAADAKNPSGSVHCFIAELGNVRKGHAVAFSIETIRCSGGKRYTGFSQEIRENFEYFLSCGIEGELEGERYKKTPQLIAEHMSFQKPFVAPKKFIIFKPLDQFEDADPPEAIVFFAGGDVLSGLFTLANFDSPVPDGVIAPFGSGCSSIVYYPYHESKSDQPRAVLGMFDVSARPHVPKESLTFAVPWNRFKSMVANLPESFLITESWGKVRKRIVAQS